MIKVNGKYKAKIKQYCRYKSTHQPMVLGKNINVVVTKVIYEQDVVRFKRDFEDTEYVMGIEQFEGNMKLNARVGSKYTSIIDQHGLYGHLVSEGQVYTIQSITSGIVELSDGTRILLSQLEHTFKEA